MDLFKEILGYRLHRVRMLMYNSIKHKFEHIANYSVEVHYFLPKSTSKTIEYFDIYLSTLAEAESQIKMFIWSKHGKQTAISYIKCKKDD